MTHDLELLELAAAAARLDRVDFGGGAIVVQDCDGYSTVWNPLVSERDALELMTDLRMGISYSGLYVRARIYKDGHPIVTAREKVAGKAHPNRHAATRRAIVRAAAELGRSGEKQG